MLVSATEMLKKAKAGHYAVGQFNINNLEWTKAILLTAQELNSPVILGVSEGAGKYMTGYKTVVGMVNGMMEELNQILKTKFNTDKDLVKTIMNYQVFFNTDIIEELGLDYAAIKQVVVDRLKKDKDVHYAFDMEKTSIESIPEELKFRAINGYNRERSGGVQIVLKPGHYDYYSSKGTTHGAWNPYDIHIPCLFMGWGIQHGESAQPHYMTDIAATVCAMLHIQAPNGCIGTPIF